MTDFDPELIAAARSLGSATLHEAAGRIGSLPATIQPVDQTWRLAGPARTVVAPPGDNLWLHRALEAAEPGDVLVVATGDEAAVWGYWGEIMSVAASTARIGGLVLQGGTRDHRQLIDLGFPIFSLGPCIRGTVKGVEHDLGGIDVPVVIGDITIRPGDLIVGDADGVVAIPRSQAAAAVASGAAREEAEAGAMDSLRRGATTNDLFGFAAARPGPADPVFRLRQLDSCQISDALDSLGVKDQVVTGIASLTGDAKVAGRAITVRLGPIAPDGGRSTTHLCAEAVDRSSPADVIVIDHQGRSDCAGWGGNLSIGARRRGCAATLIDGAARDIDEARNLRYPVFALSSTPQTARGRAEQKTFNEPIKFGGVQVGAGDLVIADSTGIVFIPSAMVGQVLDAAESIAEKESELATALGRGSNVADVMSANYESMLKQPGHAAIAPT